MERKRKIIHNRCKCLQCGDIIESKTTHDWVCCSCFHKSNGETGCFTDGGTSYIRRGGHPEYIESMDETRLYTDEERDEYNRHQELLAEQYGWVAIDYME